MDFSALEAYVMVCREGKMTRAAQKLFLSKQTLSMVIKRIEGEMDAQLLVRGSTGVEMTREGRRFYEYACQILALWRACGDELGAMKARGRARLRVGFGYMIWNFWTKELGEALERSCPGIELAAEGGLSRELLRRLDEGELDVAVTCMQLDRYAHYECRVLRSTDVLVTMAQEDPLAGRASLTPWDLAGRRLLYPDSGAAFLEQFCAFLKELGVHADASLVQAGNFLRNLHAIREQNALKLTNSFYHSVVPSVDGYVTLPLVYDGRPEMPRVSVCALTLPDGQHGAAAGQFIEFLARQMQENGGLS